MIETIIEARGLRFSVRRAGSSGEPVMLLHGFPESSAMWTGMMDCLVSAGYCCVAPDQRGYSPGARPEPIDAYRHEELVADILALADALGWPRFHLVAHDWGACIAWLVAIAAPSRVASLTALSIPHYHAFAEATWSDPEVEGYRRFLKLVLAEDAAAERVLSRDDMAGFRREWAFHSDAEVAQTVALLQQPGALSAVLAWYRASDAHRRILGDPASSVEVPTLLITGRNDPYARGRAVTLGETIPTQDYRHLQLEGGHWLVQQCFAQVADAVLGQLRRNSFQDSTGGYA
jgi:pimeloyl-ACP methyl ester carboxylesterase